MKAKQLGSRFVNHENVGVVCHLKMAESSTVYNLEHNNAGELDLYV